MTLPGVGKKTVNTRKKLAPGLHGVWEDAPAKFNIAPKKLAIPKDSSLPTINFQGRAVGFRECMFFFGGEIPLKRVKAKSFGKHMFFFQMNCLTCEKVLSPPPKNVSHTVSGPWDIQLYTALL